MKHAALGVVLIIAPIGPTQAGQNLVWNPLETSKNVEEPIKNETNQRVAPI